jgi:hypothetical protein
VEESVVTAETAQDVVEGLGRNIRPIPPRAFADRSEQAYILRSR